MKAVLRLSTALVAAVAGFYAVDFLLNAYRSQLLPKNFSVVKPNVLYRGGQLRADHLQRVIRDYGIKTVVCLNPKERRYEEGIARRLGTRYIEFHMPGSGQGEPQYFHEFLEIVGDPANRPVYVHCFAGAYRTGASVALYRMLYDGWNLEDAVAEMKYSGFAGQQDLIDHVRQTYESIPAETVAKVASTQEGTQNVK